MSRNLFTIIGFICFTLAFLSIILMLVGVQFDFLRWMDARGRGYGLLLRLLILFVGFIIFYLGRTNWDAEIPPEYRNQK